jgi:hypothetical protein
VAKFIRILGLRFVARWGVLFCNKGKRGRRKGGGDEAALDYNTSIFTHEIFDEN